MADQGSSDNLLMKILGGVFATIIAPILVAIGLKFTDKVAPAPEPAPVKAEAAGGPAALVASSSPSGTTLEEPKDRLPPAVRLFNGQSLRGFHTQLAPPPKGAPPQGKKRNPEHPISVRDGMIHFSGQVDGGVSTLKEYENYRLTVVYKWGERTWPPRQNLARMSGVLLHCQGEPGAINQRWMESVRCLILEGNTGNLRLIDDGAGGQLSLTAEAEPLPPSGDEHPSILGYQFKPGSPLTTFSKGGLVRLGRSANWANVKGFHESGDIEKPPGEWNTLECTCLGDLISVRLNGKLVNEARTTDMQGRPTLHKGKIMLQSEKAEIFFREILLQPLPAPAATRPTGRRS